MVELRARAARRSAGDRLRQPRRVRRCTLPRCGTCSTGSSSTSRPAQHAVAPARRGGSRAMPCASGDGPTSLQQNCSGKHAGMLATCRINGWPIADYLEPEHPLQVAITAVDRSARRRRCTTSGIDGCGAPTHVIGARRPGPGVRRDRHGASRMCVRSMTARPDLVGGPAPRRHPMDAGDARARRQGRCRRGDGRGVARRPGVRV